MGISAQAVRDIKKGFQKIDYERDELLFKIKTGWQLDIKIPESFEVPKDIKQHLGLGLPLLDRQIRRLQEQLSRHYTAIPEQYGIWGISNRLQTPPIEFSLGADTQLTENMKKVVMEYLQQGIQSAVQISELLVKNHGAPNDRLLRGRPRIYTSVCMLLDGHPNCTLLQKSFEDRLYQYND